MKIYYEKKVSTKTQRPYDCLYVNLGYRTATLSFDRQLISELLHMNLADLYNLPAGKMIEVGEITVE